MTPKGSIPLDFFFAHVTIGDGCWEWTGYRKPQGYGQYGNGRDGSPVKAHRFAYELLVGPIPDGLELDHLCRNPSCVRPDHLEPVTHRENMLRSHSFIARKAAQTHCVNGDEYTPENTGIAKNGTRHCKTCKSRWDREFYQRSGRERQRARRKVPA